MSAIGAIEDVGMSTLEGVERQHSSGVQPKRDVRLVRGLGTRVWDDAGREYLDFTSGLGVASLGHSHPAIAEAVARQARTLVTCPESFFNDRRAALLSRLVGLLPNGLDRIFLCNSGSESIEAALKFARVATGRAGVVAAKRGFHGRTFGALTATWEPRYRDPFEPLLAGFTHIPFDDLEAADAAIGDRTSAVVVEIVQGEGGVRPGSTSYFEGLRALCDARGALLIFDEVQTGFGRTGRLFACEHHGVSPDVICLGKALGGGVPIGAVAFNRRIPTLTPGSHGSTFGGNPLACAAALAAIDVIEGEQLVRRAEERGRFLLARLRMLESRLIREIRGVGLMVGIELRIRVARILRALEERSILAVQAGPTVIRFLPPLVVSEVEIDRVVDALAETLDDLERGDLAEEVRS
jgi:acetylornithine/LysW-gamma-L-lysine aminotransferase